MERAEFDRVIVSQPDGGPMELTAEEYAKLPLDQRVRAILQRKVRFFLGETEIPMASALGRKA